MMASMWQLLLVILIRGLSVVAAEDARIAPSPEVPAWQLASLMHLHLTGPESEALDLTYSVYPLTERAGSNGTDRSAIWIRGSLVPAEVLDVERIRRMETIAFLSCDGENATGEVNSLMGEQPTAILLYSADETRCSLEGADLDFDMIYTMGDSAEALDTLNNTIRAGGILRATITGSDNLTMSTPGTQERSGGNSAVAMSILYSITGLITLLFLVIIGTGAIRAHRYPERYGPRSGYGGRPSQSRARGLARAVLETLPIVKFGDTNPAKPDPALELESQTSATGLDPTMGTRLSAIPEEPRTPHVRQSNAAPMSGAVREPEVTPASNPADISGLSGAEGKGTKADCNIAEENLGCSICTEDFSVGEDVRVLPCDHKFHPPCIDPWLINVSGTCPLCRLDLHQQTRRASNPNATVDQNDPFLYAPPLAAAENWPTTDQDTTAITNSPSRPGSQQQQQHHRRRSSRFLDLHRLRHASVEESIEILRRHRAQQRMREAAAAAAAGTGGAGAGSGVGEAGTDADEQHGRSRTRLADRLRERFHIRTARAQGVAVGEGASGNGSGSAVAVEVQGERRSGVE